MVKQAEVMPCKALAAESISYVLPKANTEEKLERVLSINYEAIT